MVRKFVVQALAEEGFDIREAEGGEPALALLEDGAFRPELLLTDLVMRGMNGRMLYEKVKSIMPGIRVIYMSGYTRDIISRHGVLDEGLTFLQKPFAVPVLLDKVREVLQNGG
jgi:DNA-binding NtrC family response regulator